MKSQNDAVNSAVGRVVWTSVNGAVRDEVRMNVYWSAKWALRVSLYWPVRGAVGWAVDEDLPHPALQDFLEEAR
jgi:hypothetical protein